MRDSTDYSTIGDVVLSSNALFAFEKKKKNLDNLNIVRYLL